ncbi:Ig-like domain-containing protein [uncultured Abyssibacter sp.]|uniref:Ig-like domain-containing protein n=1 Tax=uncultured Abyssibacter sp. TaxID=2320202 RepID=UPI0032B19733
MRNIPDLAARTRLLIPAILLALTACGQSATPPGGDGPRTVDDLFTVTENSSDNVLDVLANDGGDDLVLDSAPEFTTAGGTLERQADDTLLYTPPTDYTGADRFQYAARDADGATASATAEIVVQADAPPPVEVACDDRDPRLAAGLGYCFDAYFETLHDGTRIDMTVYVPHPDALGSIACPGAATAADCGLFDVEAGELGHAPLVVHSHGFGGAKNPDFSVEPAHFVDNQAALAAWNAGYFVISFSQRGFGQSGGQIGLMSRELEGLDHNELLDWAIKPLRGESSAGAGDSIYAFEFDAANPEHISSAAVDDARPSLLMNDQRTRLAPAGDGEAADPAVGMLGYSYGGGWQYTASTTDTLETAGRPPRERFDALIPEGTWNDLRYSLHANDVPKGYWITLLFGFAVEGGTLSNGQPTPALINQAFVEAMVLNRTSADIQNTLGRNGVSDYCDATTGVPTTADVFHIQGVRDTLFDFNEAYDDASCFARSGNDVRFLLVSGGHPLTVTQQPPYTGQRTSMDIDEIVHCELAVDADGDGDIGQERLAVSELMFAWFEDKLRGDTGAADVIPVVCMTQPNTDPDDTLVDDRYHPAGQSAAAFRYLKEGLSLASMDDIRVGASSPSGRAPAYVCDGGDSATCDLGSVNLILGGAADLNAEVFVPVYTVPDSESRVMAGLPTARLQLNSLAVDPIVFVGMGLERDGELVTLHDQITAIRNTTTFPWADSMGVVNEHDSGTTPYFYGCSPDAEILCERGRLSGVSIRLLPGDRVGPIFSSADIQYPRTINLPGTVTITGDVELPIEAPSPLPPGNNPG